MYNIFFEGLSDDEKATIRSIVPRQLNEVIAAALSVGDGVISRWFGSSALPGGQRYNEFDLKRKTMNTYLTTKCTRLTYVKKRVGQYVDNCQVERGDLGQVIRSAFDDQDAGAVPAFVPSGIRVYVLGDTLLTGVPPRRRFHTMAHEITHRVIQTVDHWYGEQNCLDKAVANSARCLRCAANWGWFYTEVMERLATV